MYITRVSLQLLRVQFYWLIRRQISSIFEPKRIDTRNNLQDVLSDKGVISDCWTQSIYYCLSGCAMERKTTKTIFGQFQWITHFTGLNLPTRYFQLCRLQHRTGHPVFPTPNENNKNNGSDKSEWTTNTTIRSNNTDMLSVGGYSRSAEEWSARSTLAPGRLVIGSKR